jgi:hypothetical protein
MVPKAEAETLDSATIGPKASRLYFLAQGIAVRTADFFDRKGPGAGDKANGRFMALLRSVAKDTFKGDFSEKQACQEARYCFDFYFPDEQTAVEVALSLHNPISEYERDIFKCLLAREEGLELTRLIFISRPGALNRQGAPGPRKIAGLVEKHFGLRIEILELEPNSTSSIPSQSLRDQTS